MFQPYAPSFGYVPLDGPLTPPPSDKVHPVEHGNESLEQLCLGDALLPLDVDELDARFKAVADEPIEELDEGERGAWRPGMPIEERKARRDWLMEGRGVSRTIQP